MKYKLYCHEGTRWHTLFNEELNKRTLGRLLPSVFTKVIFSERPYLEDWEYLCDVEEGITYEGFIENYPEYII